MSDNWVKATSTAHVGFPTIFLNLARATMLRRDEETGDTWVSFGEHYVAVRERPEELIGRHQQDVQRTALASAEEFHG